MQKSAKDKVKQQFTPIAKAYRDEPLFSEGEDLHHMMKAVVLSGSEQVLDIGTGAGHTAFAFAPFVRKCIGLDLTDAMVEIATQYGSERNIQNVEFCSGDAENLPFPNETFDIVTCRFAAHHFADNKKAIQEIVRVLKPGGTYLLVDHYAPENQELDSFVNHLDRLRDSSHVREYKLPEYQDWFEENGFTYQEVLKWDLPIAFQNWIQRARTPLDAQQKLIEHIHSASPLCKNIFRIEFDEQGIPYSFCLKCVLIQGVKNCIRSIHCCVLQKKDLRKSEKSIENIEPIRQHVCLFI